MAALAAAGAGILWIGAVHFISMTFNARAWQILLPHPNRPSILFFLWSVWLRESVNSLLPVARIGGEVVTANLLIQRGVTPPLSIASLIGDVTITLVTQLIFTFIGLALLVAKGQASPSLHNILISAIVFLPLTGLFIFLQKIGSFKLLALVTKHFFGDRFVTLAGNAAKLDLSLKQLYQRHAAVFFCAVWQMAGWFAGAAEIWLSLYFLGHSITIWNAIIIESLIQALSSSAFVVPGALGVQEGGFVVVGGLTGLTVEISFALALLRRARDITIFVPALTIWQFKLGKALLTKKLAAGSDQQQPNEE